MKVKTSIYVDRELWERFKKGAALKGVDASSLLEEALREEVCVDELLASLLAEGEGLSELDFDPVEVEEGSVSSLVREMRDGRARVP